MKLKENAPFWIVAIGSIIVIFLTAWLNINQTPTSAVTVFLNFIECYV